MSVAVRIVLIVSLLVWLTGGPMSTVRAAPPTPIEGDGGLLGRLQGQGGGEIRVAYHVETGRVRFIGTRPGSQLAQSLGSPPGTTPQTISWSFLAEYGPLFGLVDPHTELAPLRTSTQPGGRFSVRWQQRYAGVPVLGGELIVQLNADGAVTLASGEILPDLQLDTSPRVSAAAARATALSYTAEIYDLEPDHLLGADPALWIFSQALLGGPGSRSPRLVWRVEVTPAGLLPVRELVLVDAVAGDIVLSFNQVDAALERRVFDNANNPAAGLPGIGPVGTEMTPPPGPYPNDAANAYDYTGFTYDFYKTRHNRDSIDNYGMALTSTVRYCPSASACPYANAFWNGRQMVFGAGFASADDVTAHELTHGVTRHESGLLYYMQSGAINEALSDIWGELTDLTYTNGYDNDSAAVRWYLGEDTPFGPARNMKHPPEFGHPDRMTSRYYYCSGDDNGGVHRNNGVANKAAYLMVDGGTFNGQIVTGLGIDKAAQIWYEVQTGLLTSAANYQDLADALRQACLVLIGTAGITAQDCSQVDRAVEATEMEKLPLACMPGPACSTGATPIDLYFDDFELDLGGWRSQVMSGEDWWQRRGDQPASGAWHYWARDQLGISDTYLTMEQGVALPAGPAIEGPYLLYMQNWGFEQSDDGANRDGGVLEYTLDDGMSWKDSGSLFTQNGYTGLIDGCCGNPLAGRPAFVGSAPRYVPTRLNLESLRGQTVRFRFRLGTDNSPEDAMGWLIDDVRIYACDAQTYLPVVYGEGPP
jgi:Zn-dependent metalloprotease